MNPRQPNLDPHLARPLIDILQDTSDDVVEYAPARLRNEGSTTTALLTLRQKVQKLGLDSVLQGLAIGFSVPRLDVKSKESQQLFL